MEKIDFKNLPDRSTPLSAEILNEMQENIEDGIFDSQFYLRNEVLWENEESTIFNPQDIVLTHGPLYDFFVIFAFRNPTQDSRTISVLIEKGKDAEILYHDYYNNAVRSFSRPVTMSTFPSSKKVTFGNCTVNGSTNNALLIPYKIVGFKYYNL